jgi:hypothetical protein
MQMWDAILGGGRLFTMSCSDKLARWNVLGVQGALLSLYIEPIYFKSLTIGSLFHEQHLTRAVYSRISGIPDIPEPFVANLPLLHGVSDPISRVAGKSPLQSINWTWGDKNIEVIESKTGKLRHLIPSRLCKQFMFQSFLDLWDSVAPETVKGEVVESKLLPSSAVSKAPEGSDNLFFMDRIGAADANNLPFSDQGSARTSNAFQAGTSVSVATPPQVTAIHMRRHCNYSQVKNLAVGYQTAKRLVSDYFQTHCGSAWITKPQEQDKFML